MVSMADETPNVAPPSVGAPSVAPPGAGAPADEQADSLADELLSMGSFGDGGSGGAHTNVDADSAAGEAGDAAAPGLEELEALLKQANFDDPTDSHASGQHDLAAQLMAEAQAAANAGERKPLPPTSQFDLPAFQQAITDSQASSIDLLRDVELNVKIELGRSQMLVEDVLKLNEGAVVELDKLAGDPVDVFVNDRLVARGEVLVLNDNFCVRVNEIVQSVKEEG